MPPRRRLARASSRHVYVRFQQSTARMALTAGRLDAAVIALRATVPEDFEDEAAAREHLSELSQAVDDETRRRVVRALSALPVRAMPD